MKNPLLTPFSSGNLILKNRVIMAPMTRCRAPQEIATDLMANYYEQRASAGLIITEAVQVSKEAIGYILTPGIYTEEQVAGWRRVTNRVHAAGGKIFVQLWHCGRISHSDFHGGQPPKAPSAVAATGNTFTPAGIRPYSTPQAMTIEDIKNTIADFTKAARFAIKAGFDGVEIHGANGYLPDQFVNSASNHRTDEYGGSIENRSRFVLELVEAVCMAIGSERTAIRVSPAGLMSDMEDETPLETYGYLVGRLNEFNLAYLHLMESLAPVDAVAQYHVFKQGVAKLFRPMYKGVLMINGGYDREKGNRVIGQGDADLVSFGVPFIANPDLPLRFEKNLPLNEADRQTFYGGTGTGYTDYAFAEQLQVPGSEC